MTVRYTAVASMDESALRDVDRHVERWRDKIELRLDNRQVFFLFFGSAVVACMLFVLGVMVGKRIESRGQAASPELQDPLAALDRAHKPRGGRRAGAGAAADVSRTADRASGPSAKPATVKLASRWRPCEARARRAQADRSRCCRPVAPKPIVASLVVPKPVAAPPWRCPGLSSRRWRRPSRSSLAPKPVEPAAAPPSRSPARRSGEVEGEVHAAPEHVRDVRRGQRVRAALPGRVRDQRRRSGRGTTYRVRYGNFPRFKDATSAKENFEKQHGTIALIAAR